MSPNDIKFQEITTKLSSFGYNVEKRNRKSQGDYIVVITNPGTNRALLLKKEIAPIVGGTFKSYGNFSKIGEVSVGSIKIVAKDSKKVSLTGFDARLFAEGGKIKILDYQGSNVNCFSFTTPKQIEESVLKGAENNPSTKNSIDSLYSFFKTGHFDWGNIDPQVINKFGVYLGEILIGWVVLSNKISVSITGENPFRSKIDEFLLPNDPSFSGIDSIFRAANNDLITISSKFGSGRPGSFFSNIMPKIANNHKIKGKTAKQLQNIVKQKGLKPTDAKNIVYEWGVNNLLGLRINQPSRIVNDLISNKNTKELNMVIDLLIPVMKKYKNDHPAKERLNRLPKSLTSCFNYLLSKNLQNDSIEDICNSVAAKDYHQANLDKNAFLKGNLKYSLIKAGKTDIKLVYKQSPILDFRARNGWINYEINNHK